LEPGTLSQRVDPIRLGELIQSGKGLIVYKNGIYTVTIECGLSFKRALFGIWISDRPVQENLKHGMLGR
jgi:hypothetical protein